MKAGIAATIALVTALMSGGAMADGNILLAQCQQFIKGMDLEKDYDRVQAGMCVGFVEGVLATSSFYDEELPKEGKLCTPTTATNGQLVRIVVKYMKDNPAKLNQGKTGLVWRAIKDAYPCKA
ncbi:Rap1a/Tai family immunity protein [Pseudomonas hormoni]